MRKSFFCVAALILGLQLGPLAGPAMAAEAASGEAQRAALAPEDTAAVGRAIAYLNGITTLTARFVQVSSNGGYAEGEVMVARPGKLRFDYDPPVPVVMIANGLSMLYYDRELKQASFLPLWETPLWFLLREEVKLSDTVRIVSVERATGTLRITLSDARAAESGQITLVFSDRPMVLKKWELIDPQGVSTQVALVNARFGVEVDSTIFDHRTLDIERGRPDRN